MGKEWFPGLSARRKDVIKRIAAEVSEERECVTADELDNLLKRREEAELISVSEFDDQNVVLGRQVARRLFNKSNSDNPLSS